MEKSIAGAAGKKKPKRDTALTKQEIRIWRKAPHRPQHEPNADVDREAFLDKDGVLFRNRKKKTGFLPDGRSPVFYFGKLIS